MATELVVDSLHNMPELRDLTWNGDGAWPTFMDHDQIGELYYGSVRRNYPEHVLVAYEPDNPGVAVARGYTVPFAFGTGERTELPDGGWDTVILWATMDRDDGVSPNRASALEIVIRPDRRGRGYAAQMLAAMRKNVRQLGFAELVAPVRPNGKPDEPLTPAREYAFRTRDDGLPVDPWLRVHVRGGGEILGVCPRSMVLSGTLSDWREWTGLAFDKTGDVIVPGALVPVHCSVEHDYAVYVEPNVWVRHRLT